ncbi:hypothetical protein NCS57_00254900 [Fusarium keratoplasticum]|uniref:Uncharacterized protein n=1 Tax=Fusarium keratoplasticum TaxID=1328300 RepID=A0ACC0RAN1_9HYPO|nr:hypothetical protein NCS57_00254900 [Fusarium keratoplasticum]KAI8679763.1 hypothetical protein NCS57_00254900 [Fusarium keratoplasticum]KAI8685850.1 hypothetical protein NCS55_00258600 [Fusarium keratoplasticum]
MRSIVALAALALSGSVQLASASVCRPSATTDLTTTTTSTSAPVVTNELKGAKFARRAPDGGIVDFEGSGDAQHAEEGYKGDGSKDNGCVQMHADSGSKRALGPDVGISQQVTGLNPSTPYTIRFYTAIVLYPQTTESCFIRAYLGGDPFYEQALFTSGPTAAYSSVVRQASAPASSATFSIQMQCSGGNAAMIYVDSIFMSNQVTPQNIDDYDLVGDDDDVESPTTTADTETSQASSTGTVPPETESETATSSELSETESETATSTEPLGTETQTASSTELPETESQTVTGTETSQTESAETTATTSVETSQTDVEAGTTTGTETGDVETSTTASTETSDVETGTTTATETSQTEAAETGTTTASETSQTEDAETGTTTEAQSTAENESTVTSQEASESTTISEESTTVSEESTTASEESTTASEESTTASGVSTTASEELTTTSAESTTASEESTTISSTTSSASSEPTISRICANVGSNPDSGKGCDKRPVTADPDYYFSFVGNIEKEQCAARCLGDDECGHFEYRYVNDCHKECRIYSARLSADSPTGPSGDTNIWAYDRSCAWQIPCWQPPADNVCLNKFADTPEPTCVRQKATLKQCAQPWLRLTVADCTPEESCAGACATYTGCVAFSLSSDPNDQRNCLLYTDRVEDISEADDSSLLEFVDLDCYACNGKNMALTTYAQPRDDNTPKPDNTCAAPNNANFFLATPGANTATTLLTSTRAATTTEAANFA